MNKTIRCFSLLMLSVFLLLPGCTSQKTQTEVALKPVTIKFPEHPVIEPGIPGPIRRMALFNRQRSNASGIVQKDLWPKTLQYKKQMKLPDYYTDDPGVQAPTGKLRASMSTITGVKFKLTQTTMAESFASYGIKDRVIEVQADKPFSNAALIIGLSPEEVNQLDPATLHVFRYHKLSNTFQLVMRSALSKNGNYVFARINKPGVYAVFGLPRDVARRTALEAIYKLRPMGNFYENIDQQNPKLANEIVQKITQPSSAKIKKILSDPMLADKYGLHDSIGRAELYEGGVYGPIPRDAKGHPIGSRPVNESHQFMSEDIVLPGTRRVKGYETHEYNQWSDIITGPEFQIIKHKPFYVGYLGGLQVSPVATTNNKPWQFAGPSNIAGRIKALAMYPGSSTYLLAASAGGGVFKSIDGAYSWFPTMHDEESLSIGAIAFAPGDPSIVYAGTGEYVGCSWTAASAYPGVGVYRSSNYGHSDWQLMPSMSSDKISKILVHPQNPNLIYVAGNGGIDRWDENTHSWTNISSINTSDMVFHPNDPKTIYAARESPQGIKVTFDAEAAVPIWNLRDRGITYPTNMGCYFIKLDISPIAPYPVYARINAEQQDSASPPKWEYAISLNYRSMNGGDDWHQIGSSAGGSQGIWTSFIKVNPTNSFHVLAGGTALAHQPFHSTDWLNLGSGHADNHDMVFDPNNSNSWFKSYVANDGGVWRYASNNLWSSWDYIDANHYLETAQFYTVSTSQWGVFTVGGSTQDQGILVGHASTNFEALGGNEGGIFEVDPNNGKVIYWDPWDNNLLRTDDGKSSGMRDASNGLERPVVNGITEMIYIESLAIDPVNSKNLICGSAGNIDSTTGVRTHHIYRSTDGAAPPPSTGWTQVLYDAGSEVTNIVFAPSNNQIVYAVTQAGLVYRSPDNGRSWQQVSNASLPAGQLKGLAVDWHDPDTLYVTYEGSGLGFGHVWTSHDGGTNWRDISGMAQFSARLPDIRTHSIFVDIYHPDTLYVANDAGVFHSTSQGNWWFPFDKGLPNVVIDDMAYQYTKSRLYVATIGRGIYKLELE